MVAPITNFDVYSDEQLRQMVAVDAGAVRTAADLWRHAARTLQERGDDVHAQLTEFSPHWQGGAAAQYKMMMAEFVDGIDSVSELVIKTRDLIYSAADALQRAQSLMPAVVTVPELSPTTSALMVLPATVAATTWSELSDDQRTQVTDELQQHQALTDQAATARRQAVAVMSELAAHDRVTEESIPPLPVAGDPPPVPANQSDANTIAVKVASQDVPVLDNVQTPVLDNVQTLARPAEVTPTEPLFGDMYAAGSLAASAAVLGRFRLGSDWLARQKEEKAQKAAAAAKEADTATQALTAGLPGSGASSLGGGGGGGGVIGAVEPPRANPVLTGGGLPGVANPALVAGVSSGTGVAGTSGTGGMMPPMMPPMGGGGPGEAAKGRLPPWLVQPNPEEVFGGDSVAAASTAIGELPVEPPARGWRSG